MNTAARFQPRRDRRLKLSNMATSIHRDGGTSLFHARQSGAASSQSQQADSNEIQ